MGRQAQAAGVCAEEAVQDVRGGVGGLRREDVPQQGGGLAHPLHVTGGEVKGLFLAVGTQHLGDRAGDRTSAGIRRARGEHVDEGGGAPRRGQHGVPRGPVGVVDVGIGIGIDIDAVRRGHEPNVTHIAEF
ncbi:hypothetical protein GCM10010391_74110 [Streptomyces anthocyanicus]|nr:hypothetical protein GCM10010391_74110 [Streptomyces anthocyanicus]